MASYSGKRPAGIKPNDPLCTMFPQNCMKKTIAIWLLRNLSIAKPINDKNSMSILENFKTIDEEIFWSAIDRCPDCTAYIIFEAHNRRWQRKALQSANAAFQENDLDIDMLFECNIENWPGLFGRIKLLCHKCVTNFFKVNRVFEN